MIGRHAYQRMFGAQPEDWERIKRTSAEGPDTLVARYDAFRRKLDDLQRVSDEKWEELKSEVETAWAEIKIRVPLEQ
jgi:hypothetical protein